MLSADPRTGIVSATVPAIAAGCVLPLEETERALDWLTQPDKYSRTKDHDGRRIEFLPDGRIRLLTYLQHKEKDYSTPRVQKWRERETERNGSRNGETVAETVKRNETVSETTDTDTDTNTKKEEERGGVAKPQGKEPTDSDALSLTEEISLDVSRWSALKLKPSGSLTQVIARLLLSGTTSTKIEDSGAGLTREEILDIAHGWIIREARDPRHDQARREGRDITLVDAFKWPERRAEYASVGAQGWESWRKKEQAKRDREQLADEILGPREGTTA